MLLCCAGSSSAPCSSCTIRCTSSCGVRGSARGCVRFTVRTLCNMASFEELISSERRGPGVVTGTSGETAHAAVSTGSRRVTFTTVEPGSVPFPKSTFLVTTNFRRAAFFTVVGVEPPPRITRFSMVLGESLRRVATLFFSTTCLSNPTSISSLFSSSLFFSAGAALEAGAVTLRSTERPQVVDSTMRLVPGDPEATGERVGSEAILRPNSRNGVRWSPSGTSR